jgi:hypothetical protein
VRNRGGERGNRRWGKELTGGPRVAVRERGKGRWKWAGGLDGPEAKAGPWGKEREERRWAAGDWVGVCFFSFFFKSISNPFEFKSFTSFQIQILTQISPTVLKAFHKPFLTTFQTFEIKLLFKLFKIQTIFQNSRINLKASKASHQQTKTSCIQIMMHKHLLLLNY